MFQPGRYVFYFCHGLHGFSRKNQKGQMGNLWKSVQSVAENAVLFCAFVVHLRELPCKNMTHTRASCPLDNFAIAK